jgi:hypothetical protein
LSAGRHARARQGDGPVSVFTVVLGVDGLHHRLRNVQPRQVEQLEWPHAKTGAVSQDAVEHRVRGRTLGKQLQAFGDEGPAGMIHHEAGRIGGDDGTMPETV